MIARAPESGLQRWVFRDGRRWARGKELQAGLRESLSLLRHKSHSDSDRPVEALLRAGELECSIADLAGSDPKYAELAAFLAGLTDLAADTLVSGSGSLPQPGQFADLMSWTFPERLDVSVPEGFCFYAVHPLDFAIASASEGRPACVVGIRSIGTTLCAALAAALRSHGIPAVRFTVRPVGHPYDRGLTLTADQLRTVRQADAQGSEFLVVDEGPGLSGSSFLATGEALAASGIPKHRITLIGSVDPNIPMLVAPLAAERWNSFRWLRAPAPPRIPAGGEICLSAGGWRDRVFDNADAWPGIWTQLEPRKYLSADRQIFRKFIGYGHYGRAVARRYTQIAAAGFGPRVAEVADGFASFPIVSGRFCRAHDLSIPIIERIANYCAFRVREFSCECPDPKLEQAARFNLVQELGTEPDFGLEIVRSVSPDANLFPYEWIVAENGIMLKLDGAMHGESHFFPGPADIAWDLAGAIVEWEMQRGAAALLLERYKAASGDDASGRIQNYILAYLSFRTSYLAMAAGAMAGTSEEIRLRREREIYRQKLAACVAVACAA